MPKDICLLYSNEKWDLPKLIGNFLETEPILIDNKKFADNESWVRLPVSVRKKEVFIIQENTPADNLLVLLQTIDACRRGSAEKINAVIPYFGFARQDRMKGRDSVTAKLITDMIISAGATRILSMHLHFPQLPSFTNYPWDHLYSASYVIDWAQKNINDDFVVVAPDYGAAATADYIARKLNKKLAILRKKRPEHNESIHEGIMGDVSGKKILLVDDIIDTAGSVVHTAEYLSKFDCQEIFIAATHGVLSEPAKERLEQNSKIKKVMITNTTPMSNRKKSKKIEVNSVHKLFAKSIKEIFIGGSIKKLFAEDLFA